MAYSEVSICNMALQLLDASPITSLSDDTKRARACKREYEKARDETTQIHEWRAALKRASLAANSVAPAFGWAYAYDFPADAIRVLPPRQGGTPEGALVAAEIEGRQVLTDQDGPLYIRYLKYMTNPAAIDPLFARAIAARIAAAIGRDVTGKDNYTVLAMNVLNDAIADAQAMDARQIVPFSPICDAWVKDRR